jgi:hypothetical protein
MGPRSFFGVFGSRRSFPACEAVFLEVVMLNRYHESEIKSLQIYAFHYVELRYTDSRAERKAAPNEWMSASKIPSSID